MYTKLSKIAKTVAVGIFFMALLMNVKVSLTDPFVTVNNDVLAQTSSSSSSCENPTIKGCWETITTRNGYPALYCGSCKYVPNSQGIGATSTCPGC